MASGNAGSPMIWVGAFHLIVGNMVIAAIESTFLSKAGVAHRAWLIVVANYVSMIAGLYYIAPYFSSISGNDEFWGGQSSVGDYELAGFVVGMVAAFCSTLLIELPYYYFSLKKRTLGREVVIPFVKANILTNMGMFTIYLLTLLLGS